MPHDCKGLFMLRRKVQHLQRKMADRVRLIAGRHNGDASSATRKPHGSVEVLRDGNVREEARSHHAPPQFVRKLCRVAEQAIHALYVERICAGTFSTYSIRGENMHAMCVKDRMGRASHASVTRRTATTSGEGFGLQAGHADFDA